MEKIPELARDKVYLYLDGKSLHSCRQVCKEWNSYIQENIWNCQANRRQQEKRLRGNWLQGKYVKCTNVREALKKVE